MAVDQEIQRQKILIGKLLERLYAPAKAPELPEDIKKCWYMLFKKQFVSECCFDTVGTTFSTSIGNELAIDINSEMHSGDQFYQNTSAWLDNFNEYLREKKTELNSSGILMRKKFSIEGDPEERILVDNDLIDKIITSINLGSQYGIREIHITFANITADVEKIKELIAAASKKGIPIEIHEGLNSDAIPEFYLEHGRELAEFVADPDNNISCKVELQHATINWDGIEESLISEVRIKEADYQSAVESMAESYGSRIRAENRKKLQKATSFKTVEPSDDGEVRKGKVSLSEADIGDVELSQSQEEEQEQEAEEEQEMMSEREAELDAFKRSGRNTDLDEYSGEVLTFEDFQSPMLEREMVFMELAKRTAIVPREDIILEKEDSEFIIVDEVSTPILAEYILGKIKNKQQKHSFSDSIHGLSKNAFDALKYYIGHFSGGFDEDNLPSGFVVKAHQGKRIIDFDPDAAPALEYDPLRVRVEPDSTFEKISEDLSSYGDFRILSDSDRRQLDSFVKNEDRFDTNWLDSALKIMKVQDESVFNEIAFIHEGVYKVRPEYEDIFDKLEKVGGRAQNSPPGQIKNILYAYGPVGVKRYLDNLSKIKSKMGYDALELFINPQSSAQNDIGFLLSPDADEVLGPLFLLSEKEKKWFINLLKNQQKVTKFTDFKELFSAYKKFLSEIRDLGVEINDDMPIPEDGNTKVALSRILYILKNTPSPSRKEQMANINSNMEISNVGAWYAKKHDGYYLVTDEMGLKGADSTYEGGYKSRYSSSDGASTNKGFKALAVLGITDPIDFYRYIGQQLHTAPFSKYREIYRTTEDFFSGKGTALGVDGNFTILGLLAIGTTGRKGKYCANGAQVEEFLDKFAELYDDGVQLRGIKIKSNLLLQALADSNNIPEIRDFLTLEHIPSLLKYTIDLSKEGYGQDIIAETIKENIENYGASFITAVQSIYKGMADEPELIDAPASFITKLIVKMDALAAVDNAVKKSMLSIISKCRLNDICPLDKADELIDKLKGLSPDEISILSKTFMDIDLRTSTELPSAETLKNIIKVCKEDDDFSIARTQSIISDAHPGCVFSSPPPSSTKARATLKEVLRAQVEDLGAADEFEEKDYDDIKAFSVTLAGKIVDNIPKILRPGVMYQVKSRISSHFRDTYAKDRSDALSTRQGDFSDASNEGTDKKLKSLHSRLGEVFSRFKIPIPDVDDEDIEAMFDIPGGPNKSEIESHASGIYRCLRHGELIKAESDKFEMLAGIASRLKRKSTNELSILLSNLLSDKAPISKIGTVKLSELLDAGMTVADMSSTAKFPNKLIKIVLEHPNIVHISQSSEFENLVNIIKSGFPDNLKEHLLEVSLAANGGKVIDIETWQDIYDKVSPSVMIEMIKMQKNAVLNGVAATSFEDMIIGISADYASNESLRASIESSLLNCNFKSENITEFQEKLNQLKAVSDLDARYSLLEILSKPNYSGKSIAGIIHVCSQAEAELGSRIIAFKQADLHKMDVSLDEIEQYISGDLAIDALVKKYNQGTLSKRKQEAKDNNHFDESQIARVIDSLGDLNKDPTQPLSLSARKSIATDMMYVNSIGESQPLPAIDGVAAKPILDMTDAEIRAYIQHCKKVVAGDSFSEEEKRLARLNFLALTRETLCRSTNSDEFAGVFAYTSQIISVLNSMHQGNMHISEIDTGQGKSHIAALHAAMKWLDGDTVDICTSSMALAKEGLEEHSKLFKALGIRTALIAASSSPESYAIGGINYSTVSEMSLFKARAKIENTLGDVGASSLILDEADFTTLDDTIQYKYAGSTDGKPQGKTSPHAWVYRVINNFIDRDEFKNPEFKRADDIENLKAYVEMVCSDEQKQIFKEFTDVQLDKWLDSALSAKSLQGYGDYRNPELGDKKADYKVEVIDGEAHARILVHGLPSREAKWSDGVHQFLHDRLNSSGMCEFDFPIAPEAHHLASTNAKDLVKSYGTVWGMTGTIGDVKERAEQASVYGFKMTKVAPHQACRRVDHNPDIAFGADAHKSKIKSAITSRIRTNSGMPAVVVCKDMDKSKEMFEDMLADFTNPDNIKKNRKLMPIRIQIFDGAENKIISLSYKKGKIVAEEEAVSDATQAKKNAGEERTITITTPIMGRGTDFKPRQKSGRAHPYGLLVVQSYVDTVRTSGQIVGRGGRNGQPGESLTIVDGEEMARELGVDLDTMSVDSDGSGLSDGSTVSVDSIGDIREKRGTSTRTQRQERQAFGNIQNKTFLHVIEILAELDALQGKIEKTYSDKINEINRDIKNAGDNTEEVLRLTELKEKIQAEKAEVIESLPKRRDVLKDWAVLLKEFGEEAKPHKIRARLAEKEEVLPSGEHESLTVKVRVLSEVMQDKWNAVVDGISSKTDADANPEHFPTLKASIMQFKEGVERKHLGADFRVEMEGYVDKIRGDSREHKIDVLPTTSASIYCHRAVAKVEMLKNSDEVTADMLEEAYKQQMIAILSEPLLNKRLSQYRKVSPQNLEKLSGSEVLEIYNSILTKLSEKAESATEQQLREILSIKQKLSKPHEWLIGKIKKSPVLMRDNRFIQDAVQIREYERLAKEVTQIKTMISELADSIPDGDTVTFEHMKQLSDMLDRIDKARKSMQLYEQKLHRFGNDKSSRAAKSWMSSFLENSSETTAHLSRMERERALMLSALKANRTSEQAEELEQKFSKVHRKMDSIGNRIMLAFHRLGNIISRAFSNIFGKKKAASAPAESIEQKISECMSKPEPKPMTFRRSAPSSLEQLVDSQSSKPGVVSSAPTLRADKPVSSVPDATDASSSTVVDPKSPKAVISGSAPTSKVAEPKSPRTDTISSAPASRVGGPRGRSRDR